jgi:hypothetical protein
VLCYTIVTEPNMRTEYNIAKTISRLILELDFLQRGFTSILMVQLRSTIHCYIKSFQPLGLGAASMGFKELATSKTAKMPKYFFMTLMN